MGQRSVPLRLAKNLVTFAGITEAAAVQLRGSFASTGLAYQNWIEEKLTTFSPTGEFAVFDHVRDFSRLRFPLHVSSLPTCLFAACISCNLSNQPEVFRSHLGNGPGALAGSLSPSSSLSTKAACAA